MEWKTERNGPEVYLSGAVSDGLRIQWSVSGARSRRPLSGNGAERA